MRVTKPIYEISECCIPEHRESSQPDPQMQGKLQELQARAPSSATFRQLRTTGVSWYNARFSKALLVWVFLLLPYTLSFDTVGERSKAQRIRESERGAQSA